jgi:predicted nucleic acid-binding protein
LILYLIDSSALWRVLRDEPLRAEWSDVISAGAIGSCDPQRVEFRRSARNSREYEEMTEMFDTLLPEVALPKDIWRWTEAAQYKLLRAGAHQAMSVVDLLIGATAAIRGLVVLHDDKDYATAARHLSDVTERRIQQTPPAADGSQMYLDYVK